MPSWIKKLAASTAKLLGSASEKNASAEPKGILVFANTSEVIAAERALKKTGLPVEIKGPPPDLQTGCDMVALFPLLKQAAVESVLANAGLKAQRILTEADSLLEPVSLFHVKDLGRWLMARAANMKITVDKETGVIVNISGGGCPDVPFLAQKLCGKILSQAPEPISMGHTLCCHSLQKAFEELKRAMERQNGDNSQELGGAPCGS